MNGPRALAPRAPWLLLAAGLCLAACATTARPASAPAQAAPAQAAEAAPEARPPAPRLEREAYALFAEALASLEAGDLAAAEAGFLQVLEQAPRSANTRFNLALLLERQGRLAEAQSAYEDIRRVHPGHLPTLLNLGRLYRRQGRLEEALGLYQAGLLVPGFEHEPSLLLGMASALRQARKLPEAEAVIRRLLARNPEERRAPAELALLHYAQGHYRLAELVCTSALERHGDDPGLHNTLALVALKQGDRARALAELRRAVELDERFLPAHLNLGALALASRDMAGAERALARAVELAPDSPDAWLAYARALDAQKGREPRKGLAAGEAFEKVLALRADHSEAVCGAGWALASERSGWDKAVGYLTRCRELEKTSPQERQRIDSRLQAIEALRKTPAPAEQGTPGAPEGNLFHTPDTEVNAAHGRP